MVVRAWCMTFSSYGLHQCTNGVSSHFLYPPYTRPASSYTSARFLSDKRCRVRIVEVVCLPPAMKRELFPTQIYTFSHFDGLLFGLSGVISLHREISLSIMASCLHNFTHWIVEKLVELPLSAPTNSRSEGTANPWNTYNWRVQLYFNPKRKLYWKEPSSGGSYF